MARTTDLAFWLLAACAPPSGGGGGAFTPAPIAPVVTPPTTPTTPTPSPTPTVPEPEWYLEPGWVAFSGPIWNVGPDLLIGLWTADLEGDGTRELISYSLTYDQDLAVSLYSFLSWRADRPTGDVREDPLLRWDLPPYAQAGAPYVVALADQPGLVLPDLIYQYNPPEDYDFYPLVPGPEVELSDDAVDLGFELYGQNPFDGQPPFHLGDQTGDGLPDLVFVDPSWPSGLGWCSADGACADGTLELRDAFSPDAILLDLGGDGHDDGIEVVVDDDPFVDGDFRVERALVFDGSGWVPHVPEILWTIPDYSPGQGGHRPWMIPDVTGDDLPDFYLPAEQLEGEDSASWRQVRLGSNPRQSGVPADFVETTFTPLFPGDTVSDVEVGDYDGDGIGDLAFTMAGSDPLGNGQGHTRISVFRGPILPGELTEDLAARVTVLAPNNTGGATSAWTADLDADGRDDLYVLGAVDEAPPGSGNDDAVFFLSGAGL